MPVPIHQPVLLEESLHHLACSPGSRIVDCTVGGGGHAERILEQIGEEGFLLGLDRDPEAVERSRQRLGERSGRARFLAEDFRRLPEILAEQGWPAVDGILVDLGLSSDQLQDPSRGFSFSRNGPLDMRFDRRGGTTAAEIVNGAPEGEIRRILRSYGEEPAAARIARQIIRHRDRQPIRTTGDLAGILQSLAGGRPRRIHPATRTFQALRIAVNQELDELDEFLESAAHHLGPGGRIVVIGFHSLEDRIVKRTLAGLAPHCVCPPLAPMCVCGLPGILKILTRKPIRPTDAEREANPRSRSARLRAAERIA